MSAYRLFVSGLLILAQLGSAALASDQSSDELYKKGMRLLRQKKTAQALEQFRQAVLVNPDHARAHWNLACSLAALRTKGKICKHEAYRRTIMSHLFKACRLEPRLKRQLKRVANLKVIHDTFGFQRLMGLRTNSGRNVAKILRNVSWYGPAPDAHGPQSGIRFLSKGRMVLWVLDTSGKKPRKVERTGTWRVQRSRVFIRLKKKLGELREIEGELKVTGELWLPGLPGPFSDDPADCRA